MYNKETEVVMSESAGMGEPGVHSTPVNRSEDPSLTESAIVDDSSMQSTPTSTKRSSKLDNDVMSFLLKQFNELKEQNKEVENNLNNKFDEMKSDNLKFNKVKSYFDINDLKFDRQNAKFHN